MSKPEFFAFDARKPEVRECLLAWVAAIKATGAVLEAFPANPLAEAFRRFDDMTPDRRAFIIESLLPELFHHMRDYQRELQSRH